MPLVETPYLPDNVDVLVFFGGHETIDDFMALKPHLDKTDIFIPEAVGWIQDELVLMSRISQGDRQAVKETFKRLANPSPYNIAEIKNLEGKHVRITLIDLPDSDRRAAEIDNYYSGDRLGNEASDAMTADFEQTMGNIIDFAETDAELENYREAIMAMSVGPRIEALIDNDPDLSSKGRVKVLVQLGTHHTFFYHAMSKAARSNPTVSIKRVFSEPKPLVFRHFDRLSRSIRANIQLTVDEKRELAMRALGRQGLVNGDISPVLVLADSDYRNGELTVSHLNTATERLSTEDIKRYHETLVELGEIGLVNRS